MVLLNNLLALFYQGQCYTIAKEEVYLSEYGIGYIDLSITFGITTVLFTTICGFARHLVKYKGQKLSIVITTHLHGKIWKKAINCLGKYVYFQKQHITFVIILKTFLHDLFAF